MTDIAAIEKKPFVVHCRDCHHEWAAFYIPLLLDQKGMRLMMGAAKACPMCAGKKIFCGPNPDQKDDKK